MTLTDRIALAEKLGYRWEREGLIDGGHGLCPLWHLRDDPEYRRGYEDGLVMKEMSA